ncbi:periplasmic heavy metal sensor [Candidatus Poribacteria bacterium]|nr:periplasmic heavy metal sensor [Candidatus Poribacteria bacterium]
MNKKWLTIALIILTIINISILGTFIYKRFCYDRGMCRIGEDNNFHHMKQKLGLTDEQVAKMKNFRDKFHPKFEASAQMIREKRLELVKELMAVSPDSTRIEHILQQMSLSQSALQREVVNNLLMQKGIFTTNQQEKFFSIVLERFSVRNKRR